MKLISLNTWCGIAFEALVDFVKQHRDTDIFCLQEVLNLPNSQGFDHEHLLSVIKQLLPNHNFQYQVQSVRIDMTGENPEQVDFDIEYGLVMFYKKTLNPNYSSAVLPQGYRSDSMVG